MNGLLLEETVRRILRDEFGMLRSGGVFMNAGEAVRSAQRAFGAYSSLTLSDRRRVIEEVRTALKPLVPKLAELCVKETGMGRVEDKKRKIALAIDMTPGVEDLISEVKSGDGGLTLYELSAWGVVCAIHPCNNPCATLVNNTISLLAAGNAVIHIPHPRAVNVTRLLVKTIDEAIEKSCGVDNLVSTVFESSMSAAYELMTHPDVQMIVSTGGTDVLRRAMSCGKKVVGAGPGNPVAVVDETADIEKASADILMGASFDNNLMCISEKSVVVVEAVADRLLRAMERRGALLLGRLEDVLSLMAVTVTNDRMPNKALEGKDAAEILRAAGLTEVGSPRVILIEVEREHPFVTLEMRMPLLPLIRVRDFNEAVEAALEIEQGFGHTAIMHSQNIERLSYAAKTMQTSIFVKNSSSLAGIGVGGEGSISFTIATATGEGTTTARHFTRRRRCVLTESFSIR